MLGCPCSGQRNNHNVTSPCDVSRVGSRSSCHAGGTRNLPCHAVGPKPPARDPTSSAAVRLLYHCTLTNRGNRSSSPSPERQDVARPSSKNPLTWTVDDVVWFVKDADPHALGPHVELFRKHEIDGNALLLLKSDMIMKYLGLKLGPALKLCYHIDKLKQAKF
uniref:SAM domain-containing protein n=1 Tax=Calidris pygmaea TaxID=425635 RepID=A0A8C3JAF7_9CHAR